MRMLFKVGVVSFCIVWTIGLGDGAYAAKGAKARHADKNKDGIVDGKEWKAEKAWERGQKKKVNTWWKDKADADNDGIVSRDEFLTWKALTKKRIDLDDDGVISPKEKRLSWRHGKSKVNTVLEGKYDANGDGWLQAAEVKEMLKDKHRLIKTNGRAKVDSAIEEEYDADSDGILSAQEAEQLKEDLDN